MVNAVAEAMKDQDAVIESILQTKASSNALKEKFVFSKDKSVDDILKLAKIYEDNMPKSQQIWTVKSSDIQNRTRRSYDHIAGSAA